jgi:hypothetical protein
MNTLITLALSASMLSSWPGGGNTRTYEISFTNVTHGIVLTPPIFSLSNQKISLFELGQPASPALAQLAEGGATDDLRADLEAQGVQDVTQTMTLVNPGETITVQLEGTRFGRLNLASMLLPTNDGFVATNGKRVPTGNRSTVLRLQAYDAGTEINDEACTSIPGPPCMGQGFNAEDGEGFVAAHAGIHGEAELGRQAYNWGEPVAIVKIRVLN